MPDPIKYGIFGEDDSDFLALKEIVWKLKGDRSLTIRGGGFGGKGKLLSHAAAPLKSLYDGGFRKFIICHDADGPDPGPIAKVVEERVIKPSGVPPPHCIVVPVQEFEAWVLADVESA